MIIVLRIANSYNNLRQITNLPQLRTSAATGTNCFLTAVLITPTW